MSIMIHSTSVFISGHLWSTNSYPACVSQVRSGQVRLWVLPRAYKTELSGTPTAVFTEIQLIGQFLVRRYHPYLK